MSLLLKYRLPVLVIFFGLLGLSLAFILKPGELKWYYIAGTPLIALVTGLLSNFLTDTAWNKKLREKSILVSLVLCVLFFTVLFLHLRVYINGTFRYKDVNNITRSYIKGYTYTAIAQKYKIAHPYIGSDADLLFEAFGGIEGKSDVWTPGSIRQTTIHFIISYCCSIFFLSALISWILGVAFEKKYSDPQKAMRAIMAEKGKTNYEKYLLTFNTKQSDEKYKNIKSHIFLSYSSGEREIAQKVFYSLSNNGHMVFFDRNNLPAGMEYDAAIHTAILHSDIFIFMISPASVEEGRYTLTELKFASEKWPAASGVLLPVMSVKTHFEKIPAYAQSVTILIPAGNLVAEVSAEVEKLFDAEKNNYKKNNNRFEIDKKIESTLEIIEEKKGLFPGGKIPLKNLVPLICNLFERMTFRGEPEIEMCTAQRWSDRVHSARLTYEALLIFESDFEQSGTGEQKKLYQQLLLNVTKYIDAMVSGLFKDQKITLSQVDNLVGSPGFVTKFKENREKQFSKDDTGLRIIIDAQYKNPINMHLKNILSGIDKLSETVLNE